MPSPRSRALLLAFGAASALSACVHVGREFSAAPIKQLELGHTTRDEALELFGPPWRTGLEDGQRTWTYGHYRYSLFAPTHARDLVLEFDRRGVLSSYTYNTTEDD